MGVIKWDGLSDPGGITSLTDTCGAASADYRLYPQCTPSFVCRKRVLRCVCVYFHVSCVVGTFFFFFLVFSWFLYFCVHSISFACLGYLFPTCVGVGYLFPTCVWGAGNCSASPTRPKSNISRSSLTWLLGHFSRARSRFRAKLAIV